METIPFKINYWIKISLINFLIVALAGIVLRYKITFPLPIIEQKHLLHGHSHFAFTGWVSLALMALMVNYLMKSGVIANYKKYHWMLIANLITAYGMLFTFIIEGYAFFSITFSTLSIFVSYFFIYHYWKDINHSRIQTHIAIWFKTTLILWGVSSLGAFTLAFLMANKILIQELYFASIYFFLHFQYNGWFVFACFGLLFSMLGVENNDSLVKISRGTFRLLAITIVPTYFLSVLWVKLPGYLYWIAAISAFLQLIVIRYAYQILSIVWYRYIKSFSPITRWVLTLSCISFCLKLILQSLSVFPYFGNFAFSLRPVVIGYLHLCFLCVISFAILGFFNEQLTIQGKKLNLAGLSIFISGVLLQEFVLMIQAIDIIIQKPLTHAFVILLLSAIVIAIGLAIILFGLKSRQIN